MSEFRLAPEAEAEVDEIWLHIARESGSVDIATGVVENITERFWLLARYPFLGRARDEDLRPGLRSFTADDYLIIHCIEEDDVVLILHVVHGSRDVVALFGHWMLKAMCIAHPHCACAGLAKAKRKDKSRIPITSHKKIKIY